MTLIQYSLFTEEWIKRAERRGELDDGDRFISLWIAFNGWMKGEFGEDQYDSVLLDSVKSFSDMIEVFEGLKNDDTEFSKNLGELQQYGVVDMRDPNNENKIINYDGNFESLIDTIYQVRCNLFHGRKNVDDNKKDFELVSLSYRILLPLLKEYLNKNGY